MKLSLKNNVLLVLMLLAAGLGVVLKPTLFTADERAPIDLQAMIPTTFGDWHELPNMSAQIIDPQQKETLDRIYSQTLSRTYINDLGYRVLLSVAYGKNQNKSLELHTPDVCYPAQGFAIAGTQKSTLNLLGKPIAVTQLQTNLGQRFEPLTYWILVGNSISTSTLQKRLIEFRYALTGHIPDGLLFRVSSIDKFSSNAYTIQNQFSKDLIEAVAPENRQRFIGELGQKL